MVIAVQMNAGKVQIKEKDITSFPYSTLPSAIKICNL
jgi:hypothetical protein